MNIHFTRLIKIRGLLREVNFRRQPTEVAGYHVDTTDERGTRFLFTMKKEDTGTWLLSSPSLPAWIEESESLFSAAIEESEAAFQAKKRTA